MNAPSEKEQFQSPVLLSGWVNRWILESMPLKKNYSMLPSEESRKSFNITYEQCERFIREIAVLRIAGISMFIKQYYDDAFWVTFSHSICPLLANYLNSVTYQTTPDELGDAIEAYVDASLNKDEKKVSTLYMRRVYDDNDHYIKLSLGGVGYLAVNWLMDSYAIFRNSHCIAMKGMDYKTLMESVEKPMEPPKSAR